MYVRGHLRCKSATQRERERERERESFSRNNDFSTRDRYQQPQIRAVSVHKGGYVSDREAPACLFYCIKRARVDVLNTLQHLKGAPYITLKGAPYSTLKADLIEP